MLQKLTMEAVVLACADVSLRAVATTKIYQHTLLSWYRG